MCDCKNIDLGTYEAAVDIWPPWESKKFISVDVCIIEEVIFLWSKGVVTTNSCCGHNKVQGSVCVSDDSIPIMQKLGYEQGEQSFIFKTKY